MAGKMADESKNQYFDRVYQMANEDRINELSDMSEDERNQFYKKATLKSYKEIEKLEKREKQLQQECARLQSKLKG